MTLLGGELTWVGNIEPVKVVRFSLRPRGGGEWGGGGI